jgi:hypothetical protein
VEHYLATKKNKIMAFAGKWMELEIFVLREISQIQKDKLCFFSYVESRSKAQQQKKDKTINGNFLGDRSIGR